MELRKETKNFLKEISNFAIKNTGSSTWASETRGYVILLFFIYLLCSFEYEIRWDISLMQWESVLLIDNNHASNWQQFLLELIKTRSKVDPKSQNLTNEK